MGARSISDEERFWQYVDVGPEDKCWKWLSSRNANGYGNARFNRRTIGAHRLSWLIHFGEIPTGMHVCHHCDRPECCNPSHLFLGTISDNARDREKKGRSWHVPGQLIPTAKLTWDEVRAIRKEYIPKVVGADYLAEKYGVCRGTIHEILRNITWKEFH